MVAQRQLNTTTVSPFQSAQHPPVLALASLLRASAAGPCRIWRKKNKRKLAFKILHLSLYGASSLVVDRTRESHLSGCVSGPPHCPQSLSKMSEPQQDIKDR